MAEARAAKAREYGTSITSHANPSDYDARVRNHNTHKSSVFSTEPDYPTIRKLENERNAHFREVPLKTTATRASY